MSNKNLRIKKIIDALKEKKCIDVKTLYKSYGISSITLKRYLSEIRAMGYVIKTSKGILNLIKAGEDLQNEYFTKGDLKSFRILMYIYNNNPCSRNLLKKTFCAGDDFEEDKVTLRCLDMHLNKLISNNLISKNITNRNIIYTVTHDLILSDNMDFQKALYIINFLKVYKDTLPYRNYIETIIEKLEISCINYIRKSSDAAENLLFTYEIFPDCIMEQASQNEEKIAGEIEAFCLEGQPIGVKMKSGSFLKVYPFLVVFNWNLGCWYLVCRHLSDDEGFDLLRLDRISFYKPLDYGKLSGEAIKKEISAARSEIKESFALGVEKDTEVNILFLNPAQDELEEINLRMSQVKVKSRKVFKGSKYLFCVNIKGTIDFLAWVRKFGSKAVFLCNDYLRQRHLEGALNAVNRYNA